MESTNTVPDRVTEAARNCETPEELLELVRHENAELGDAMLEDVTGGKNFLPIRKDCRRHK